MPNAISLHIGLNTVDPAHYNGWDGELLACEADARDMQQIAEGRGFESRLLLTPDATADAVSAAIAAAADRLSGGDLFFLSYSGHGGQVPDTNSDEPGEDNKDETWVLFDRQLVDDELYALWSRFAPGVRIFVLSDSCHSGSVTRDIFDAAVPHVIQHGMVDTPQPRTKDLPRSVQSATYKQHQELYDEVQASNASGETVDVPATVLLISGCQDNQLSLDGDRNGLFTQQLLAVWDEGRWAGSYPQFHKAIGARMPPTQSPNYSAVGAPNHEFELQTPLTL